MELRGAIPVADHVIIIGAGIVGVSTAIWLRRYDVNVTLVDRAAPGQGTSYGNAGVLAACSNPLDDVVARVPGSPPTITRSPINRTSTSRSPASTTDTKGI